MAHDALDPRFRRLIDEHAPVRQVGSGFTFTEGPIWHPVDQYLLFSDMPADVRRRLDRSGVREVLRPSNKANGLTYDADLNLIACEHATSCVARFLPDGTPRGPRKPFRGARTQQPERPVRPFERRDLFLRSLVWPDAALRGRAAARTGLAGRVPDRAGQPRAQAARRPLHVLPAQRAVLLPR